MTDWKNLHHAYGPAHDLPELLSAISPDPCAEVWGELWHRLCHQGSTFSASYAILPILLRAAEDWPPEYRVTPLGLAAAIVTGAPCGGTLAALWEPYRATVADLLAVSLRTVPTPGLSLEDYVYLVQAVMAFQFEPFWGDHLDALLTGELSGVCIACAGHLYIAVGEYGNFITAHDWVAYPNTPRLPIQPTASADLSGVGEWLFTRAVKDAQPQLASWLLYLFGTASCPHCGFNLGISSAAKSAV